MGTSTGLPALPPGLASGGVLQSYRVGALPVLLAALVVAWWWRRRRMYGRSYRRATLCTGLVAVLSMVGAAGLANAYAGYVPSLSAAARLTGLPDPAAGDLPLLTETADAAGSVTSVVVGDAVARVPASPVWIYTPPGYAAPGNTIRYPVIYLLHGYPGRSADWFSAGSIDTVMDRLITTGALPRAIVVAPDMNGGGRRDTEGLDVAGGPQIATYLTRTVPAWADAHLRTLPDPAHRVIAGMSAGGFAALNLGLQHQQTFGGIIALEPYGNPGPGGLATLGGNRAALAANSPSGYLPALTLTRAPAVFLDVGGAVGTGTTRQLARQLAGRGLAVRFQVEPGQRHTWREARAGIPYGLLYAAQQLGWNSARGQAAAAPGGATLTA